MKIVAIVGSPRPNGNTSYLTDQALEEASKQGIETTTFVVAQYRISPCQGHDKCWDWTVCPQKDDVEPIVRQLYEADGVILASPVYYYNVSSQMKVFIDRNVFYRRHKWRLKAKSIATIVVATGGGVEDATNALMRFIGLSSDMPAEQVMRLQALARNVGDIKNNAPAVEQARELGRNMARKLLEG